MALWVFFLPLTAASSSCYRWECAELPDNTCFQRDLLNGVYRVKACGQNQKCAIDQIDSILPYDFGQDWECVDSDWLPTKKFPGEICSAGDDCISKRCVDYRCRGASMSQPCTIHGDCDVSLACVNFLCSPQRPAGSACGSDDDCANDTFCYNSVCTLLFSLKDGSEFKGIISLNAGLLCESGYLSGKKCSAAPRNENSPDKICYRSADCPILFPDDRMASGLCDCGFNSQGLSYCKAQPGDAEFAAFRSSLLAVISQSNKCHYEISVSTRCPEMAMMPEHSTFLNSYYVYYYRNGIIGLPDCVKPMMSFSDGYAYVDSVAGTGGSSGNDKTVVIVVVVAVFSVIMAAGIVCCLCVRKCAMDERNQELTRRRFLREEMEELPVRTGEALPQPEERPEVSAAFQADAIVLDPGNRRFLKYGIPLAKIINPASLQLEEDDSEWIPETIVARGTTAEANQQVDQIDNREDDPPPILSYERSKPDSRSSSTT